MSSLYDTRSVMRVFTPIKFLKRYMHPFNACFLRVFFFIKDKQLLRLVSSPVIWLFGMQQGLGERKQDTGLKRCFSLL